MDSRVSATGLKSVELDELTTDQIIINNEGLQYLHKYNILLPTITEGYYNLQEELDNIMISNTTQDLELVQLQSGLSTAQANITSLGVLAGTANVNALAAIDLANQKSWILFFQKPLRSDISSNVYLDFDTNYFSVDASNNYLTLNTNYWKKDISNNLYTTSGKVGIGLTNPGTNYKLDVLGNINCAEIYRNGTPISSTLSLFLPLTGGTLTGVLSGTTISATNMSANLFSGSGASLTNLNVSNASSGTLAITRGGIGTTTLTVNQILIGNGTTSILQSPNLAWNNTTNTLSASNFVGNGSGLTSLNASNVSLGTLAITRGGIGTTTLTVNQILIGNGTTSILQSPNLAWNNTTDTLSASNFVGNGSGLTSLNASNIISGTLSVNGSGLTSLNASNVTSGTLSTARGGSQWGFNDVNINYTAGNVMINSLLCGYGTANIIPNSSYKNYIMLRHNTYNGNIGTNFPNPECAILMTNSSGSNTLPWGFYSGVVKHIASTNANSLRYDIGNCIVNNTVVTGTGENTFTPLMSMSYSGNIGIGTTNPSSKLDVSGNINANNINLQNLSNPNNTTISINSEPTSYNSKLILGSGYIGTNPANSFSDISTCQIIAKRNNLYIDAAVGKTININSEANGDINSFGSWVHNGDISSNTVTSNTVSAINFIENSVSLTNKYVKKYGFSFLTATPIAIVSTPYFKYDINLNNYTTTINFDGVVPTRKFRIMTWLKSGYHEVSPTRNLDYEIIMSNPTNNGTNGGQAGLNIQAYSLSDSKNYRLDKISSSGQFILRNSFNYLSYVSTVQNTNIACLIIDYF